MSRLSQYIIFINLENPQKYNVNQYSHLNIDSKIKKARKEHLKNTPKGYGGEVAHYSLGFGKYQGVPICQINDVNYLEGILEELNLKEETKIQVSNRCSEIYINNTENTIGETTNYKDSPF